jgi:hypothetical protein
VTTVVASCVLEQQIMQQKRNHGSVCYTAVFCPNKNVIEWCFDQHIKNIYARLAESRVSVSGERGLKTGSKQQKITKLLGI